jgi:hypothetical protein
MIFFERGLALPLGKDACIPQFEKKYCYLVLKMFLPVLQSF